MILHNQDFYKICFENSREGIIVTDEQGIILLTNSSIESIFGYTSEELFNNSVTMLFPKLIRNKYNYYRDLNNLKPLEKIGFEKRDLYGIHKDGHKVEVIIGLNYFELNHKNYVKASISDISSYKLKEQLFRSKNYQLEQELKIKNKELRAKNKLLRDSNKALLFEIKNKIIAEKIAKTSLEKEIELNNLKTKFLSLASHEFRTPLSGILTSATLIDKYVQNNTKEKATKHIEVIKLMVHHLNSILQDFMTLELINKGAIDYQFKSMNIVELIKKIKIESISILKKNQKIKYISHNSNKEIFNDAKIISIIITNLIYNAIKYSPEQSTIEIESKIKDNALNIWIKDKGIGIPLEDQKHIFEQFFRAKNAMEIQGTGIGLNIVKGHVDGLGGNISFHSVENVGTTFFVEIPNYQFSK